MIRTLAVCCAVAVAMSACVDTKEAAPAGAISLMKVGPMARPPTNEKQTEKEIEYFLKQQGELAAKGGMDAMLARFDFPVYFVTDTLKGVPETKLYTKDEFIVAMMSFWEQLPKDMDSTHKPSIVVLSDSLASVGDDFMITTGKTKMTGRNQLLLVKIDGQWKIKSMVEAGWGDMDEPAAKPPAPAPAEK